MRVLILLFALLFSTVANAAPQRAILIDSSERALGTADNPIHTSGGGSSQWTTSGSDSTTNGNVGIGTSNPTEALEVVGNLVVSGSITALGSENMGIGTILPTQKLEVVGTIRTTGLNVGIGTTVAQQLCRKPTGEMGYFNGAWTSTCN